ncbi:MAG: diaminopimelate dehydrogenase [Clostridiales bacterium]|nr:diaminopimelate dehydrogenase [Clostridiales bacterium]
MEKIRIGIVGYGNLGKGVELAARQCSDMEVVGVFTRRSPESLSTVFENTPVYHTDDALNMQNDIDVMILCGGSATDLPRQTPYFAKYFNTVDSFDTHAKIPEYFASVNASASESKHVSIISVGWDPGLFSINRLYSQSIIPNGQTYTFWGKGVSQGHSDAIRRISGVVDARQYTVPVEEAVEAVRMGDQPQLTTRQKHTRLCYVVAENGADKERIEREIVTMPNYFADYDTTVNFISMEEMERDHKALPHGGFVIRSGVTGKNQETKQIIEFSLKLGSNPEFTSSVLVAYARGAYKMYRQGSFGAKTVFDVPPASISPLTDEEIRKELL